MASYDQNVTIDLNVDAKGFKETLSAAIAEVRSAERAFEDIDTNIDESAESLDNFSDKGEKVGNKEISPDMNLSVADANTDLTALNDRIERTADKELDIPVRTPDIDKSKVEVGDIDTLLDDTDEFKRAERDIDMPVSAPGIDESKENVENLNSILDEANENKAEVELSNDAVEEAADDTAESILGEEESFESMINSADTLTQAKNVVTQSNSALDEQTKESKRSLLKEKLQAMELGDEVTNLDKMLDSLVGKQEEVGAQSRKSALGIDEETRSFEELMDGAQDLEDVKFAVANANENVQNESGKSTEELIKESDAVDLTQEEMESLVKSQNSVSKSSMTARDKLRKMRNSVDESTDSMRAASQVGELFSEGLGSLSINLGAFTIALRNFLTQIPLLITLLGSVGSAAIGAAAAIGALGGAIVAFPLAGLLVKAQQLSEEFASIESTADALSVIFNEFQEVLINATEPLTDAVSAFSFFEDAIEGIGFAVNVLSQNFAALTRESGMLSDILEGTGEEVNTFQDLMGMIDGSTFEELASALSVAFAVLGDEAIAVLSALGSGLAETIVRSVNLLSTVGDLNEEISQFSDTIGELSELGFKIAGGLLPVFAAFSSIIESVAASLNELDDETVKNLVTFIAFIAAANKLSGVLSNVVTILPNLLVGLSQVGTGMSSAAANAGKFQSKIAALGTGVSLTAKKLGVFLNQIKAFSGISALLASLGSSEERFREIAFSSQSAKDEFKKFGEESDDAAEDLRQLARQGKLADKQLDELGDSDADIDVTPDGKVKAKQFLPEMGPLTSAFQEPGSAVTNLNSKMKKSIKSTKGQASIANSASKQLNSMSSSMKAVATQSRATKAAQNKTAVASLFLDFSASKAALSTDSLTKGLKSLGTALKRAAIQFAAASIQAVTYALAQLGIIPSALSAAGAVAVLDLALSSLTGGLTKIIPAIIALIAIIGGLTVGVLRNMDGIKSAFASMFDALKGGVSFAVKILKKLFLATWIAIRQTLEPFGKIFKDLSNSLSSLGSDSKDSAGFLDLLKESILLVVDALAFLIKIVGVVLRLFNTLIAAGLGLVVKLFDLLVTVLNRAGSAVNDFISDSGFLSSVFDDSSESGDGLIDTLTGIIEALRDLGNATQFLEDLFNDLIIDQINEVIKFLNNEIRFISPALSIGEAEDIDLTPEGGADTSRAEPEKKEGNTVTYNEDNSTEINQEVNADPEDKAALSRVVKDAINEANSFERRRQQGI